VRCECGVTYLSGATPIRLDVAKYAPRSQLLVSRGYAAVLDVSSFDLPLHHLPSFPCVAQASRAVNSPALVRLENSTRHLPFSRRECRCAKVWLMSISNSKGSNK
jgi:hypothetical protein